VQSGDELFYNYIFGYGATQWQSGVVIYAAAAENFDDTHGGTSWFLGTRDLVSEAVNNRIWVGGYGNSYISNGSLVLGNNDFSHAGTPGVLILDPSGTGAGIPIADLPSTTYLGMMTVVNNALSPVVGNTVVAGGSATALVWWNGANWTVIGK
jgi:hypothetical protein